MAIKWTPSWAIVARLVVAMFVFIGGPTAQSRAAGNLECPEIGAGHVPDLIGDTTGAGLAATASRADLVNEVNGAINRLQIADPNISWTDVQNTLIAAYCRAVADAPGLAVAEILGGVRRPWRVANESGRIGLDRATLPGARATLPAARATLPGARELAA